MRVGLFECEAYEAGAVVGRGAEDVQAVDFAEAFVRVAGQLVFVAGDFFDADEVQIVDRCADWQSVKLTSSSGTLDPDTDASARPHAPTSAQAATCSLRSPVRSE